MKSLRLRWRFFWSRRSQLATTLSLVSVLLAAGVLVYLFVPPNAHAIMVSILSSGAQLVAALNQQQVLGGAATFLLLLSVAIIFRPTFRKRSYLATAPSLIPPVSVYLDAENQLSSPGAIRPFTSFLLEHLDGRRADLLFFLDASHRSTSRAYKELYRFGFRPVDVPHDPTGEGEVKEAVDREIAMHAYERALLGPAGQEFILISSDGDFVPLVYRLAALGHRVQIWATPMREPYRTLATYLAVDVLDLSRVISEQGITDDSNPSSTDSTSRVSPAERSKGGSRLRAGGVGASHLERRMVPPESLARLEEQELWRTIELTVQARDSAEMSIVDPMAQAKAFHSALGGNLAPRLAGVGYRVGGSWITYWIEHLVALHVLERSEQQPLPARGAGTTEGAARSMFAIAQLAAQTAVQIAPSKPEGLVTTQELADALATADLAETDDLAAPLRQLLDPHNAKRATHARYFVRCARALGLVRFEDVLHSIDTIKVQSLSS